ncbi:hypothetical protein Ddc_23970 [Ditylenchus destructor]|nr:hypothetical protein Ddc_23970 [Ditylenchus destructor]
MPADARARVGQRLWRQMASPGRDPTPMMQGEDANDGAAAHATICFAATRRLSAISGRTYEDYPSFRLVGGIELACQHGNGSHSARRSAGAFQPRPRGKRCGSGDRRLHLRLSPGDDGDDAPGHDQRRRTWRGAGPDGADHQGAQLSRRLIPGRHRTERRYAVHQRLL